VRLAFFGVGTMPMRVRKAEAALNGAADDKSIDAAVAQLELNPVDDVQATGSTKKHLAGVLLKRVVAQLKEAR
jgi:aerobic carbon-monoxide dehydrogenase medium subunit